MRHLPIKPTSAVVLCNTIMRRPIAVDCATTTRFACLLPSRSFKLDSYGQAGRNISQYFLLSGTVAAGLARFRVSGLEVSGLERYTAGSGEASSVRGGDFKPGKQERWRCFPRSLVFLFTSSRSMLDLSPQIGDNAVCLSKASCQPIRVGIFGETPCWGENERDLLWSSCWW